MRDGVRRLTMEPVSMRGGEGRMLRVWGMDDCISLLLRVSLSAVGVGVGVSSVLLVRERVRPAMGPSSCS